ncbi:MAG TPA: Uma2 family endonuclease, partial [Leptolyngbyaceae cyanobacterium M33_DOE_097]|nr:Uma2 family endonuclease [Leptolyngbyaceae cyanobacterium M33_DOE_097]
ITTEQFEQLCAANRELKLERSANGDLIIMPPTGGGTGKRNSALIESGHPSPRGSVHLEGAVLSCQKLTILSLRLHQVNLVEQLQIEQ